MESSAKTSSSPHHHNNPFLSAAAFCLTAPHPHPPSAAPPIFRSFNLNNDDDDDEDRETTTTTTNNSTRELSEQDEIPKEPLFEKPLTPSDVGKLNRLVIPKQHAEKHFPLNAAEPGENGLLLSFEDEVGKSWRFRYSYWNSSQSYVLTKGWSRFVKEKRLDAGDVVVFSRHRGHAGQLFIGWRRRHSNGGGGGDIGGAQAAGRGGGSGGGWNRQMLYEYPYQQRQHHSLSSYQPECLHAGSVIQNQATAANGNLKTVRLFGVNLECQPDHSSETSTPVGSPMSSQGQPQHVHHHPYHHQYYSNNHMDISFSGGDVYRQG